MRVSLPVSPIVSQSVPTYMRLCVVIALVSEGRIAVVPRTFTRTQKRSPRMMIRTRHPGWTALVVLLALWLSSSLAFGQAQAPGPVVKYQFRVAGLPQPARFNI